LRKTHGFNRMDNNMETTDLTYNGLPVITADDDFIEYLREQGYTSQIDMDELIIEWDDWAAENVL
jgi:hypothetical protein